MAALGMAWAPVIYGFGLITEKNIWCQGSEIHLSSDLRIKTDISNIDDDRALQQVNALESKEYNYIDPERKQPMKTIGFIAQDVKEVVPNAVSLQKNLFQTKCESLQIHNGQKMRENIFLIFQI